ncbi:Ndc80_HEC domain-containing protein [Cephalotus follicularis]|uniref:Kinetochore protein NDC80 n=1 Tax=Cephalotus follicularis TaxID=3775 RepID=A0A1Q3BHH9_CEPFO|nr:Ndc80_HEC domain-containing protein [Cephalotus follicularis]
MKRQKHYQRDSGPPARDSDASFASSRPSSAGIGRGGSRSQITDPYTNRENQSAAIRVINDYLSSHSFQTLPFPPKLPSAKDITDTLRFLLSAIDYPTLKLEDDLFLVLKFLNCPFKINKSTLRSPNSPHNWPTYLAVIHWMVQIASYTRHVSHDSRAIVESNTMYAYWLNSYLSYMHGDDDSVEALDREFVEKLERERDSVREGVGVLEGSFRDLEVRAERLRTGPTEKEGLEKERRMLEEDVGKFQAMISEFNGRIAAMDKVIEEKEREKAAKEEEMRLIREENEELRKKVDSQTVNSRDAERMKRELVAVERDINKAETERNEWEEKAWDLDSSIGQKFKELEAVAMDCNQAIRRLKLGNNLQYVLNAKGSTPGEILGIDYKSTIKPALEAFADGIKKNSMAKLEELIPLQQQASEMASKIEGKKNRIAALQSHIEEVEGQCSLLKKETQDYTDRCAAEARKMMEDVQMEAHNLDIMEREAAELLKASEMKLQEVTKQTDDEIQICARELFTLVDSVSKHKEYMESKLSEMESDLSSTVSAIADAHRGFMSAQYGINFGASH